MCVPGRKLAAALCSLVAGLLIAAPTVTADTGVVSISPHFARPGERVDLMVGCGACPADANFPVSLVPVAKTPRLHPCAENAVCEPTVRQPPRERPFVLLGSASASRALLLRFSVPDIEPGHYAFVLFCASCVRGPRGSLIADTSPGTVLRILPGETPARSGGDGADGTIWIVAGAGAIALLLAVVLLLRRKRTA